MAKSSSAFEAMISHPYDTDPGIVKRDVINLVAGTPGFSCLAGIPDLMLTATQDCLTRKEEWNSILSYGSPVGYSPYLEELKKFLTEEYNTPVYSLMSTAGSMYALGQLSSLFAGSKAPVFVCNPTYYRYKELFLTQYNLNCLTVPVDEGGVQTNVLEKKLQDARLSLGTDHVTTEQPYWGMMSVIPLYDNPTGCILSQERCNRLIELAEEYNLLVVADDIYSLHHYTDEKNPPPRLMAYEDRSSPDFEGRVVSVGSFSKILAPGFKVGWIEGPVKIINKLSNRATVCGGSVCHYTSAVVASALRLGLIKKHLIKVRSIYKSRLSAVIKTLEVGLPSGARFISPQGGYFIWIRLPSHMDIADFCHFCDTKFKVTVAPGERFYFEEVEQKFIRISFGYYDEEVLIEGTKRLCQAIKTYLLEK